MDEDVAESKPLQPEFASGYGYLRAELAALSPGRARAWFAPDVVDTLGQVEQALGPEPDTPLLAVSWPRGADVNAAITHLTGVLADVALARWPDWYGERAPFAHPDVGIEAAADYDDRVVTRLGETRPALDRTWAKAAVRRCRRDKPPAPRGFPHTVQVRQLAQALSRDDLVILLALDSVHTPAPELLCFARTAAWLAGEANARVAAVVPAAYRDAAELDAISYGAVDLAGESRPSAPARAHDEPARLVHPPIIGRPHPASPGEQLLARWLARDGVLAGLFEFNQRVETSGGESFVVDLLWRDGRMTVEVDGYGWHSSPHAFAADRHRDYRLLCDGYRTLRLPHDEVVDDPALQVEKIRDVVHAIWRER